ncbi:MAG: hypothetical protein E7614_05345 [Ruminococcaceae bacterium]|nr:hypothetical protein [Oscillospiraceae bacterium]
MKKITSLILLALLCVSVFCITSCGDNSLKDTIDEFKTWETEADKNGASIRWEFSSKTVKYVNVFEGEDTFSQTFNLTVDGNKFIFQSDYATLTFDVAVEGDTMTVNTETGSTLVFKKK